MSSMETVKQNGQLKGTDFEDKTMQAFLNYVHKLILDEALVKGTDRNSKVINFQQPEDLKGLLNLDIGKEASSHEELLSLCAKVIEYSVKTGHPRFFNQLYSGLNVYGLAGSWLTDALNTNIHTYEVSPVFILMEKYLIEKLSLLVGYSDGDGLFCPGGSYSNIMAMNLARFRACPQFKSVGMYGMQRMKLYTSEEAHYSMVKGAVFLGMGADNVVKVGTNDKGQMIPEELERTIIADKEKDELPLFVMATAGTTVLGAYDQLEPLAEICDRHGVWLHCDACWGGAVLLSGKYRHFIAGIERMDSVCWNAHKLTAAPLQCSTLLLKQKGLLQACNQFKAEYLFQPDKCYDTTYDIGDKTVQCGKKVDSLKLWMLWKSLGDVGMAEIVDRAFDNSRYFAEKLKKREGYRLVIPEFQCTNVCFWYIPKSLWQQEETAEWWQMISKVAPKIKERMMKAGTLMIGYQPLSCKGYVNFFRLTVGNAKCNHSDMDFILDEIDRLGKDL